MTTFIPLCIVDGGFHHTVTELSCCKRNCFAHKAFLALCIKCLLTSGSYNDLEVDSNAFLKH